MTMMRVETLPSRNTYKVQVVQLMVKKKSRGIPSSKVPREDAVSLRLAKVWGKHVLCFLAFNVDAGRDDGM